MNLQKLFETQAKLDEHIYEKHPELRGQNNLDWKILALQVELGECANEWRGFKKWSNDQEPRTYVPNPNDLCKACDGQGYTGKHLDIKHWKFCKECDGCGAHYHNPLLEEYVDCLHFILSIGNDYTYDNFKDVQYMLERATIISNTSRKDTVEIFNFLFHRVGSLATGRDDRPYRDDILPLFLVLGERLGFSWDEIEQAYFAKNKINHERQESGY
ncbi:dUTP diphosphatase [Solibacillus sp. FSL W8-0372]|uniref:dUTP diphosphatase n=1 Tax=Solibacillus sp. FSL W8-0372 TaxID=2921713 RepID=UPI0030D179D1